MLSQSDNFGSFRRWFESEGASPGDTLERFVYFLGVQLDDLRLSGKRILEIGCGTGAVSVFLAMCSDAKEITANDEAAGNGSALDITKPLKNAIASFDLTNLEPKEIDVMLNDWPARTFDIIIANNSLHHVVTPGLISRDQRARRGYLDLFRELKRLLVPGGFLSMWEYSRQSLWRWSPWKFKWKQIEWELHPTQAEWLAVMKDAGFVIRKCEYKVPYRFRYLMPMLANPVAQFLMYPSFFITAQNRV